MRSDPSVYALSVQLSLESQAAFASLDTFSDKVVQIESQVASAAKEAIASITAITTEANKALLDFSQSFQGIDSTTVKINTNLAEASKELQTHLDNSDDRLKDGKKEFKQKQEIKEILEEFSDILESHHVQWKGFYDLTGKIIEAVKKKNLGHKEQNKLLTNDVELAGAFGSATDRNTGLLNDQGRVVGQNNLTWASIWNWIQRSSEATERFVATNYRAYGSQSDLLANARALGIANGIMSQQTLEAYAVMGNLKVPREELDKYADIVAKTSRATQVGIGQAGEYANRLRVVGLSLPQVERQLVHITEAMRKFGLSTHDVQNLMAGSSVELLKLKNAFGGSAEQMIKLEEGRFIMAGLGKQIGLGSEGARDFYNWITRDYEALARFGAFAGMAIKSAEDLNQAQIKAGVRLEQEMTAREELVKTGKMSIQVAQAYNNAIRDSFYGGSDAAMLTSREFGKVAKQLGLTGSSADEFNRIMERVNQNIKDPFSEANRSFIAQWRLLSDRFWTVTDAIGALVGDALMPLLQALNWTITQAFAVGQAFADVIHWLEQIPGLGYVITYFKWTAKAIAAVAIALVVLTAAAVSFMGVFGSIGGLFARLAMGMQFALNFILNLASVVGQGIVILLTSIGQGFLALGNLVRSVTVPLLALGAALLMAGGGAYLFALGVRTVAEVGWAAIPAMLGLIAAVAVLGVVLVGIATLIQGPIAVGMVVLGATLLMIGAGAWLAGQGLAAAGAGLTAIAGVMSFELLTFLGGLGIAVVALGAASLIGAPGIVALSVALSALGLALRLVVWPMETLMAVAAKFMGGVEKLAVAIGFVMTGLVGGIKDLAAVSPLLVFAATAILAGGLAMIPAAIALTAAGTMLLPGSILMAQVGRFIEVGGQSLLAGSPLLAAGAQQLQAAVNALWDVNGLFKSASLLLPGAAVLVKLGAAILLGGKGVAAGSAALFVGTERLRDVAGLFQGVAATLGALAPLAVSLPASLENMKIALAGVLASLSDLAQMAGPLGDTGAALVTASGWLVQASGLLLVAGQQFTAGGLALHDGSRVMNQALAELNGIGALSLLGGLVLLAGTTVLVAASAQVAVAGSLLLAGGAGLLVGARSMAEAVNSFSGIDSDLVAVGATLLAGAGALLGGSALLAVVSGMIASSAGSLSGAATQLLGMHRPLAEAGLVLAGVGGQILAASMEMALAGQALLPASIMIYLGMNWLDQAVSRFRRSTDSVKQVSLALASFALSFQVLSVTPMGGFRSLVDEALQLSPNIAKIGVELLRASDQLKAGVDAFEAPANRLDQVLSKLTNSMARTNDGLKMAENIGMAADYFNNYAGLMENAAERIDAAILTKALPAMRAAEKSGLEETVKAQTINTVQILDKREGDNTADRDESVELLGRLAATMDKIESKLDGIGTNNGMKDLLDILRSYLPNMVGSGQSLGSDLNNWR